MNKLLIILLSSGLVACGENEGIVFESAEGKACTSEAVAGGVNIVCPDGTTFIKNGIDGTNGKDGIGIKGDKGDTGAMGLTGAIGAKGDTGKTGAKGDTGDIGATGAKGDTGVAGVDGIDGTDGKDGVKGDKGDKGDDGVILSTVKVNKNTCTQVHKGIWVENIQSGTVFDVYYNNQCKDSLGEYCDNVLASFGDSGSVDASEHAGSGTTCWTDNVQVQGHRKSNGDILIKVLDYN